MFPAFYIWQLVSACPTFWPQKWLSWQLLLQVMSTRSSLASLQEVLDDAAGKGTESSELCQRLAKRLNKAHAWSERAAHFFAAAQAASRSTHPQQAPTHSLLDAATPAAGMAGSTFFEQQPTETGGQSSEHVMDVQNGISAAGPAPPAADGLQAVGGTHERQMGGPGPASSATTSHPAATGYLHAGTALAPMRGHQVDSLQVAAHHQALLPTSAIQPVLQHPAGPLPLEVVAEASAANTLSLRQRPQLSELETLVTEGNLLGVKLDALNEANATLSRVRAWLKQASTLSACLSQSSAGSHQALQDTCAARLRATGPFWRFQIIPDLQTADIGRACSAGVAQPREQMQCWRSRYSM